MRDTTTLLTEILADVKNRVLSTVNESNDNKIKMQADIKKIFDRTNLLNEKMTEWNLFSSFKNFGTYIEPQECLLGEV